MSDLRLKEDTYELQITNGDLVLTSRNDAIRQHIVQRIKTFKGEWFLDADLGVPYYQEILKKNPNIQVVSSIFKNVILETPGVLELNSFDLDYDGPTRKLFVNMQVLGVDGPIEFDNLTL